MSDPISGAAMIAAERQRQIVGEGWTPEHDDKHTMAELAYAAACYILSTSSVNVNRFWPRRWATKWWKPSTRIRDLTKAGALIAAEIDRLRRTG